MALRRVRSIPLPSPGIGKYQWGSKVAAQKLASKTSRILQGQLREADCRFSRQVKLFVSSTFDDTVVERDYLMEHVFPLVQRWCSAEFGLQFTPVDL